MMNKKRNFDDWLATFRASINSFKYYIDFDVVHKKAEKYKIEINLLNSLVGSQDIENDFSNLVKKYPECLNAIPLILAVRENELYCQDENMAKLFSFHAPYEKIEDYVYFMKETGLFDLLQHHIIANLFDYVTGVEVGLCSNGRKNRGGHQMEDLVEQYIKNLGCEYYKEMYLHDVERKWGVDLSAISSQGTTTKRWDFVIKTKSQIYVIETNFYASSGSKLNETARSYKLIAEESKDLTHTTFIWITDGEGWKKARRNLEETFNSLDTIYNIKDLENGELERLIKSSNR